MTKFLKGDATAAITLALADGFDYSGKTVHLEYQGARRSFSGVAAGGSLTFSFTAAETAPMSLGAYPVRVWMEDENGGITTIKNADVKLCVTDSAADVHPGGAIYLDVRGGLYGIEGLPERYTDEDLRRKIHEILRRLGGTVAAFALAIFPAFGATVDVQTAPKGTIYNDEQVVTNVVVDVSDLVTTGQLATAVAFTNYATRAELNTGWWSEWSISPQADGFEMSWFNSHWEPAIRIAGIVVYIYPLSGDSELDEEASFFQGSVSGTLYTIRRHRVAAPVPTKPSDIGAASVADATLTPSAFSEWTVSPSYDGEWHVELNSMGFWVCGNSHSDEQAYAFPNLSGGFVTNENVTVLYGRLPNSQDVSTFTREVTGYTLGNQTAKVLAPTNGILRTESDPTVSAWAKAERKPTYNAGEVGAYSAADGTNLANVVNLWEGYWDGTNVIFEVTNYYGNTSGEIPRLRIKELREGVWQIVWDEANKFQVCETNIMSNVVAYVTGEVGGVKQYAAENFAPVAWGTYTDKGTTNVVGNSVWMTAPETYFAGGTEYQRVAVGSGMICVLTDNGALAKTVGEPGTFRFQDEGGTNYFGFAKSDSFTIGCNTDGIAVEGTLVTLRYDVIMGGGDVPIVYWRQSLTSGEWVQLNNADGTATQGAPYTVTWYTSGGSYYAAINCGANASGFFKAETSVAGDVVFETNMKMRIDGGLSCTNTSTGVMGVIRPTFDGSTVIWNWSAK